MPTRTRPPAGGPTWASLWTSDVPGAREFYKSIFGWDSTDPDPELGGYFNFMINGVRVAGGSGDMGDIKADNTWTPFFHSADVKSAASATASAGGVPHFDPQAVMDLGSQFVLTDPQGATAGIWEPDTFVGFTTVDEHGTPSWFELHSPDHSGSLAFYKSVLGWDYDVVSDIDEFRYYLARNPDGGDEGMAGLMDNSGDLPDGAPAFWRIYWQSDNIESTIEITEKAGGQVLQYDRDTPYGHLAELSDPVGCVFAVRQWITG